MKRESFFAGRNRSGNLLHIETDGAIINIRPGLHDHGGREVTSVEIIPDRTTDGTWALDGYSNSRVIQLRSGETELPADTDTLSPDELACLATTAVELWEETMHEDPDPGLSEFQRDTLTKARGIRNRQMEG